MSLYDSWYMILTVLFSFVMVVAIVIAVISGIIERHRDAKNRREKRK